MRGSPVPSLQRIPLAIKSAIARLPYPVSICRFLPTWRRSACLQNRRKADSAFFFAGVRKIRYVRALARILIPGIRIPSEAMRFRASFATFLQTTQSNRRFRRCRIEFSQERHNIPCGRKECGKTNHRTETPNHLFAQASIP